MLAERETNLDEWVGRLYEGHLARVELARLRAEVEKLRAMVDTMTQTNDEMFRLYEERGAEVEKLRADVAWAVRHGASASYDGDSHPAVWYEVDSSRMTRWGIPVTSVEYDGTDASMLSAVRRAREANDGLA